MALLHSPRIITDDLTLCLDAGNKDSYPGTGTVWTNLAGKDNGTLINGPTFNNAEGGNILLDGTNDYIDFGNILNAENQNISGCVFFKIKTLKTNSAILDKLAGPGWRFHCNSDGALIFGVRNTAGGFSAVQTASQTVKTDIWNWAGFSYNASLNTVNIFYNGTQRSLLFTGLLTITPNTGTTPLRIGYATNNAVYSDLNVSHVLMYNRNLSAQEMFQNYNAIKGRYNL